MLRTCIGLLGSRTQLFPNTPESDRLKTAMLLMQAQAALAANEQLPIELLDVTKDNVLAAAYIKANYRIASTYAFAIATAVVLYTQRILT